MDLLATAWILDVVFFAVFALGILIGCAVGFVRCVCKIAGWLLSVALAVAFCVPFKNSLESWFGLQTALYRAIGSDLAASWLSVAIAFVALVILIRLLAWAFGALGTKIVEKTKVTRTINRFLGGLVGLVGSAALLFLLLALFYWINVESANAFISQSAVVGKIYSWEWFRYAAEFRFIG